MRICFVTSRFPYPITKGDTLRAYHQIRELSREHSVHLIAATETAVSEALLDELRPYCSGIDIVKVGRLRSYATIAARGLSSTLPLQVLYFMAPEFTACVTRAAREKRFDVIHAMTIRVAPAVFAVPEVPVVFDFMDSFAANISTRRQLVGPLKRPVYDIELSRVGAYERSVAQRAAGGVVIAELDRFTIGNPLLAIAPNGVDSTTFSYADGERDPQTLIFTGNMGYQPNIDAVTWFVETCWPQLHADRPKLRFQIVGARPTPAVVALGRQPGIEVTGRVDSIVPYLQRATLAVCPIRCGSGMQNKLLEAMSTGAPVVTTDFANRGIGATAGRELQVGTTADEFNAGIRRLLDDPHLRLEQAKTAKAWVDATYGWGGHVTILVDEYKRAIEKMSPRLLEKTG